MPFVRQAIVCFADNQILVNETPLYTYLQLLNDMCLKLVTITLFTQVKM